MIKRFEQYIQENINNKNKVEINLLYSAMTAIAILKPKFFEFLEDPKNRYNYLDRNFWQSFILEIKTNKQLKVSSKHIQDLKNISINDNWLELKQCIKAANILRKKYFNINRINVNDDLIIITDTERIRFKDKDYKIEQKDIEKVLGFNLNEIYNKKSFHFLTKQFIELLKMYLKPEYLKILDVFLDDMFEKSININYDTFKNHKIKGLGEKAESLPKLYYNTLFDFCDDITQKSDAFREYQLFIDTWEEKRKNVLFYDILKELITNNTKKRKRNLKKFISKNYSIDTYKYFTFDKKLNIRLIPSQEDFSSKKFNIFSEKTFLNVKKSLVLHLETNIITIDFIFEHKSICPNEIKVNYYVR